VLAQGARAGGWSCWQTRAGGQRRAMYETSLRRKDQSRDRVRDARYDFFQATKAGLPRSRTPLPGDPAENIREACRDGGVSGSAPSNP